MVALGMAGFAAGVALGLRFKVLVLVPAQMLAMLIAALVVLAGLTSSGSALWGLACACAFLQLGYAVAISIPWKGRRSIQPEPIKA